MAKSTKGSVIVGNFQGWLRIRWRHLGKRYTLTLGLPDSKPNRAQAEALALTIQNDIAANVFDDTLRKYKSEKQEVGYLEGRLTAVALFQEFMSHKSKHVAPKTMEKYRATLKQVESYFGAKPVEFIGMPDAEAFVDWLRKQKHPSTKQPLGDGQIKRRLEELEACWKWHLEPFNPWDKFRIKPEPKQPPQPFTQSETEAILQAFKSSPYFHYYPFVLCLFLSGARTGEIIGLKWKALNDDCSHVWITEIITRGVSRPVKSHKARSFGLSSKLAELLRDVKGQTGNPKGDELVFKSPEGKAIDDHNFSQRAWSACLKAAGIEPRKLYSTRATYISHALANGVAPTTISQTTGHDLETMYNHYAGFIQSSPKVVDWL